ncbi:uncharacterized protein ISCGN_028928 [Ixodes scapularis]
MLAGNIAECESFIEACLDFNLSQLVTIPTRSTPSTSNILYLILTTQPDLFHPITTLPGLSDENVLFAKIILPETRKETIRKLIRSYGRANYDAINSALALFYDQATGWLALPTCDSLPGLSVSPDELSADRPEAFLLETWDDHPMAFCGACGAISPSEL